MKVLVAPNAFKGSLGAGEAAAAMAVGVADVLPEAEIVSLPVADGGDGFITVLAGPLGLRPRSCTVSGPLGQPLTAHYLYDEARRLALIELAQAAGLAHLAETERRPLAAHTLGVGQLLVAALDDGARDIVLGLGGSASTDGGMGLAVALGVVFRDAAGEVLAPSGAALERIASIDLAGLDPRLRQTRLRLACDVDNPLLGARGSARVFAPQKGADADTVRRLEAGLTHFASLLREASGRDVAGLPGAGAAGGLAAGAVALFGAQLRQGAELVLELLAFDRHLPGTTLVLTGEGRLDAQSLAGKAPVVVARHARRWGVPCVALVGELAGPAAPFVDAGMVGVYALCHNASARREAMVAAAPRLRRLAARAVWAYCAEKSISTTTSPQEDA